MARSRNQSIHWGSWLGIALLVYFAYQLLKQLSNNPAGSIVDSVVKAIDQGISDLGTLITSPFTALGNTISGGVGSITGTFGSLLSLPFTILQAILSFILSPFTAALGFGSGIAAGIGGAAKSVFGGNGSPSMTPAATPALGTPNTIQLGFAPSLQDAQYLGGSNFYTSAEGGSVPSNNSFSAPLGGGF